MVYIKVTKPVVTVALPQFQDNISASDFEGFEHHLCQALGLAKPYPYGQLLLNEDAAGVQQAEPLLVMTPISLAVGQYQILFAAGGQQLALQESELLAVTQALSDILAESGLTIVKRCGPHFICKSAFAINSAPWWALANTPLADCLPDNEHKGHWQRLFTECQMLLSQQPMLTDRHSGDKASVNAVWFWGQGAWQFGHKPLTVVTDNALLNEQVNKGKQPRSMSLAALLELSPKQINTDLVLYLKQTTPELEKWLKKVNRHFEINYIFKNGIDKQPQKKFFFW